MNKPDKHILLEEGEQFDLVFDHSKHGRVELSAGQNPMSNAWMWWFNKTHSMYAGTKLDVSNIVKGVRDQASKIYMDTFWRTK